MDMTKINLSYNVIIILINSFIDTINFNYYQYFEILFKLARLCIFLSQAPNLIGHLVRT